MSSALPIFIFGCFVFAIVSAAVGIVVLGIVEDHRSRSESDERPRQDSNLRHPA